MHDVEADLRSLQNSVTGIAFLKEYSEKRFCPTFSVMLK